MQRDRKEVTKNSSFFKKVNLGAPIIKIDDDPVEEQISEPQEQQSQSQPEHRYPMRNSKRPLDYLKDYLC